jgi:hypothetical protein
MRADIHDGPEHTLQAEAGYIDARLLSAGSMKPLATHGRTIHLGHSGRRPGRSCPTGKSRARTATALQAVRCKSFGRPEPWSHLVYCGRSSGPLSRADMREVLVLLSSGPACSTCRCPITIFSPAKTDTDISASQQPPFSTESTLAEVIGTRASAVNLRIVSATPLDAGRLPTFN